MSLRIAVIGAGNVGGTLGVPAPTAGMRSPRPAMTETLLAIVLEAFTPDDGDPRAVEIVLTRQPYTPAAKLAGACGVGRESLSWT